MRLVRYEDEAGWLHQSWVTENMPLSDAERGVPYDPPDLARLDWDDIQRDINNLLIERGLITLKDISHDNMLGSTILSAIQPRLVELYKEQPGYKQSPNTSKHVNGSKHVTTKEMQ